MSSLNRDDNFVTVLGGVTDDGNLTPTALQVNASTKRLKCTAVLSTVTVAQGGTGLTALLTTYTPGIAGTATLTANVSNVHSIAMPAGNITIAFSGTTAGQVLTVDIIQDSGGSRTVTWPAGIKWAGGSAPTLTVTANKADIIGIQVITAGSSYYGYVVAQNL